MSFKYNYIISKNTKRLYLLLLLILGLQMQIQAQNKPMPSAKIEVIGKAYKDSLVLRWAPNTPVAWEYSNKYGYRVEKYLLVKDGKRLDVPQQLTLPNNYFKTLPVEKWEAFVKGNKWAAIAAQSLYGETIELSGNYRSDFVQVINKSRELESRFSFALFAADHSIEVAKYSGLKLSDKDVKKGEKYLYRVYAQVPDTLLKIDTGFYYIGLDDYKPLPKLTEVKADPSDKAIKVSWSKKYYDGEFISYAVERSEDNGKSFKVINTDPLINTTPEGNEPSETMFYLDSIPENDKKYFYRVKGLTPFGDYGPASDTVSATGVTFVAAIPAIVDRVVLNDNTVKLTWEFPEEFNSEIKSFTISRSDTDKGKYEDISSHLSPSTREFVDSKPLPVNYYVVNAYNKRGEYRTSFASLVQLIDSIPPAAPIGLEGKIDSVGRVVLTWKNNEEEDLYGYRVYRSNFNSSEYSLVTKAPLTSNVFYDTVSIKTLSKNVFYSIVAIDRHFNPSGFSTPLIIKRPDVIPPVSPAFTGIEASREGVILKWYNSSSEDVTKHLLYRRISSTNEWVLLSIFYKRDTIAMDSIQEFLDMKAEENVMYEYTLLAVDDSNLESEPSKPVRIKKTSVQTKPVVEKVFTNIDRDKKLISLAWEYENSEVDKFLIYKGKEGEQITLYKTFTAETKTFTDEKLIINTTYTYKIKASFKDGSYSPLSKEILINY